MKAVCSSCLGPLSIDEAALREATAGKHMSTIYASDDLAFPGIGVPKLKHECPKCGSGVPIAVDDEVAETLARYPR